MRILIFLFLFWPTFLWAQAISTPIGHAQISLVQDGLNEPWSIGFLPQGVLITERGGQLLYLNQGQRQSIQNLPPVQTGGQSGLFDVLVPRDFAKNSIIYLSYAKADGSGTAIARARLNLQAFQLENTTEIFAMNSPSRGTQHFGGRLLEAKNGEIYLTLGDRGARDLAQQDGVLNGRIIAYNPSSNQYRIISKGHRNPQGLAMDETGQIYTTEHGAKGGDEINEIHQGRNYGWPIISYGTHYDGSKIGIGTHKDGLEQPKFYWDPSIAPSGLAIYSGRANPRAKDILFAGSLKFNEIALIRPETKFDPIGTIQSPETLRVRDVREAPDGSIWFLSVGNSALYRIDFQ